MRGKKPLDSNDSFAKKAKKEIDKNEDAIYSLLRSVVIDLIERFPKFAHKKIREFEKSLRNRYPNYLDYRMYNALIGATREPEWEYKHFDFPGEDSVQKFILNLWNECLSLEGKSEGNR